MSSGLLPEQEKAAIHIGSHARLLAGPGTGKTLTLTRRVQYLIERSGVPPSQILVVTFTRAAAAELRERISDTLSDDGDRPHISTLHSFALRQLVRNANMVETLPRPIRVADDWEERNIVHEYLKIELDFTVGTIRERFNQLSADWETLEAETSDWSEKFIDPTFLGAWQNQRAVLGYTLRAELVYQVKRSLEQTDNFKLESEFAHTLVDEYQDLNKCDLAVIRAITDRGSEQFAVGDDDQSIYGFRKAYPEGIRQFTAEFSPSESLSLSVCMRCDKRIITLAEFVANQDTKRLPKDLAPRQDAGKGEVHVLRFQNQVAEAKGISSLCQSLIDSDGLEPRNILILIRTDRNQSYSKVIRKRLQRDNIPVSSALDNPLDSDQGRRFKAVVQLIVQLDDSLSLCTWLILTDGIGEKSISALTDLARQRGWTFAKAARQVQAEISLLSAVVGSRIRGAMSKLDDVLESWRERLTTTTEREQTLSALNDLATELINDNQVRQQVMTHVQQVMDGTGIRNLEGLVNSLSSALATIEPPMDPSGVNIMTMHKAKGLTADAVIIAAAEDELIPGGQDDPNAEGDERRLLYVSLTRARTHLFLTYCDNRMGQQKFTGRSSGKSQRRLTRFLRNGPIKPSNGLKFVEGYS